MRTLAHLDLHLSLPSEGASAATAAAESFPDVSTLAQGIEQIAPIFSDIPFLDLRNTKLSDRASEALARTIDTHTSLTQLDLRRNQLSSLAVPRIFSALSRNTSLESLKLGHNLLNFFPACASPTVTFKPHHPDRDVRRLAVAKSVTHHVADALIANTTLTCLDLSHNGLSPRTTLPLIRMISLNVTLKHLDLQHNRFGDDTAEELAQAILQNSTLTRLNLSHTRLRSGTARQLAVALEDNPSLKRLDLDGNDLDPETLMTINTLLKRNRHNQKMRKQELFFILINYLKTIDYLI